MDDELVDGLSKLNCSGDMVLDHEEEADEEEGYEEEESEDASEEEETEDEDYEDQISEVNERLDRMECQIEKLLKKIVALRNYVEASHDIQMTVDWNNMARMINGRIKSHTVLTFELMPLHSIRTHSALEGFPRFYNDINELERDQLGEFLDQMGIPRGVDELWTFKFMIGVPVDLEPASSTCV